MTDLTEILNWRRINDWITTSGQPSEAQLVKLQRLGITHVINLGPHDTKGALKDEAGTVASLGMIYIHIPVDFEKPTDRDFEEFCKALIELSNTKVHVHCIYNARVSAFFYRYAKIGAPFSVGDAYANMESIWRPGSDWAKFIGDSGAAGRPNLYAGEDY
ncbi:MAG: protein tyrosine phosphatase family protein [Pseudomonadota bacterium]